MALEGLSVKGSLAGALIGLGVEVALKELMGLEVIHGLLEILGAGFGMLRIDRDIYEASVRLLQDAPITPNEDYREVLERIDRLTEDLPELRENFLRLIDAGLKAREA
jgi:hypothetical protein